MGKWQIKKRKNIKKYYYVRSRKIFFSEKIKINFDENNPRFSLSSTGMKNLLNSSSKKISNFFSPQKDKNFEKKEINLYKKNDSHIN